MVMWACLVASGGIEKDSLEKFMRHWVVDSNTMKKNPLVRPASILGVCRRRFRVKVVAACRRLLA